MKIFLKMNKRYITTCIDCDKILKTKLLYVKTVNEKA